MERRNPTSRNLLLALVAGHVLLVWLPLLFLSRFASNVELFFGRFHPTVVHLPIGVLIAALVFYVVFRGPRRASFAGGTKWLLYGGAWMALLACFSGLLLARGGGYDAATLAWHRALGIAVATTASVAWFAVARYSVASRDGNRVLRAAAIGAMTVTLLVGGHLGGMLTHGDGFLTRYLPDPFRRAVGMTPAAEIGQLVIQEPSTTTVHDAIIQPIFNRRCVACHNADTRRGRLSLQDYASMMEGGRDGDAAVPGSADESLIIERIWLPPDHDDHMPPIHRPQITVAEAELIRWWIDSGASETLTIEEMEPSERARAILAASGLDERRSGIFALDLASPDTALVSEAIASGLQVSPLALESPFLDVRCRRASACLGPDQVTALEPLLEHVALFDAAENELAEPAIEVVGSFAHLTHARLELTGIGDAELALLGDLEYLEVLNVYGTGVTDAGLEAVGSLPALRRIYAWQTDVTNEGAQALTAAHPAIEVILGDVD